MEIELFKTLMWVIGGLLSLLVLVIGWIGVRIHSRLDSISASLASIEKELRGDLAALDRRLTLVELKTYIEKDNRDAKRKTDP